MAYFRAVFCTVSGKASTVARAARGCSPGTISASCRSGHALPIAALCSSLASGLPGRTAVTLAPATQPLSLAEIGSLAELLRNDAGEASQRPVASRQESSRNCYDVHPQEAEGRHQKLLDSLEEAPALPLKQLKSATSAVSPGKASQSQGSLGELGTLVGQFREQGAPPAVVDWMVDTLASIQRDRAALLKRSWSDTAFEDGEEGNDATLARYERELVGMLRASDGLADGEVLGNAIDLAGAYKKNYRLDKAEAVLMRTLKYAEERGGAWLVKHLNHLSQVRMKQRRDFESLEMMYEMESLAAFPLEEKGASEFYETLYRNMSSALRSMGREEEAAAYFAKMVEAARVHKESLDWMDLWDLGLLIANRAYHSQQWKDFHGSRAILGEALRKQSIAEPHELILRAKVLSNLGQCYLATAEHHDCDTYYSEAYHLFDITVGKRSPLFGMQAWACANLRCAEGRYSEALPLLGEALFVEVVREGGLSVSEMAKLADQTLMAFHESPGTDISSEDAGKGTEPLRRSLDTLSEELQWEKLENTLELAVLAHKFALIHVAARWRDARSSETARRFNAQATDVLNNSRDPKAAPWATQANAIQRAVFGLPPDKFSNSGMDRRDRMSD